MARAEDVILEGILTTCQPDGSPNIAAMGAVIDGPDAAAPGRLVLRPYKTTASYANLKRTGEAVFHLTDDVELLARAALDRIQHPPRLAPAAGVQGWVLADACRWHVLRMIGLDDSGDRALAQMEVVGTGRNREFAGLCRAKHAVVEAAILATRIHLLPPAEVHGDVVRLSKLVSKTGGPGEIAAFSFLLEYIKEKASG